MLKKIILVVVVIAAAKVVGENYIGGQVDEKIAQAIEQDKKQLPKVIDNAVRLVNISYANRTVHYDAVVLKDVNIDDSRKAAFQNALKEKYCNGNSGVQHFRKAGVALEYAITFESSFYKGIEWDFKIAPTDCV